MRHDLPAQRPDAEAVVALRDGSHIRVRQGCQSDRELLLEGFAQLSEQSRYRRFLAPMPDLTEKVITYLLDVDHHDHEAIIAIDVRSGHGIGVARYLRLESRPHVAEVAVTVVDDWQGKGVGTLLLEVAGARARQAGIRCFSALMLSDNVEMREALAHIGPLRVLARSGGTIEVEAPISQAGLSPQLRRLLRVAACNDVGVSPARRTPPGTLAPRLAPGDNP